MSRGTVAAAYAQLVEEGYLSAAQGSGTVVERLPDRPSAVSAVNAAERDLLSLRPGVPDVTRFPVTAWLRSSRKALTSAGPRVFDYGHPLGVPALREAISDYLGRTRGVDTTPDTTVITSGTIHSTFVLGSVLRRRGTRRVAVEEPMWSLQRDVLATCGLEVVPLPVDSHGARTDLLASGDLGQVGAVVVTPAHQFPTGVIMSASRRRHLLGWATSTGGIVLEDDYDGEFRFGRSPLGTVQGLGPNQVIYLGSASKALAPALRLGWMVLPPEWVPDVQAVRVATDLHTDVLTQLTLAEFLASDGYDAAVRSARLAYQRRRATLTSALQDSGLSRRGFVLEGRPAGLHVLLTLPAGTDERAVYERARAEGLRLWGVRSSYLDPDNARPGLVIGYAAPAERDYRRALDLLLRILEQVC